MATVNCLSLWKGLVSALVFTVVANPALPAGIKMSPPSIRVNRLNDQFISVAFCDMDLCTPIGSEKGYTLAEWEQIRKQCEWQAYYGKPLAEGGEEVVQAAGIALMFFNPLYGVMAFLVGQNLDFAEDLSATDILKTADSLPNLLHGGHIPPLSYDLFQSFKQGLEFCTSRYDVIRGTSISDIVAP